jgi:inner membrane transporter RhtA
MGFLKNNTTVQSIALLMVAIVSVQTSASLAKTLFATFPVLSISALRLLFGFMLLAIFFKIWRVAWQQIRWASIIGYGLALAGMNALFYLSLHRLPLGIAVSFEFIGPLSVALLHAKHRYDLVWVGLAILGLVLLFPWSQTGQALDPVGIVLAIGAGACWAVYILTGNRPSGISGNHTVCLGMFVGMLILMPLALFSGLPTNVFEPSNLIYFVALAVLASALPFSLEMIALRNLTALSFGTLMSLEPAIAALSGFVFLGEQLLWSQWLALSVIIMASIGCTYTAQKNRQATV